MTYTILARKYRPQKLSEIAGQEQVVITLTNAIKLNRIAHAYLFAGPRGTGKTTTARVLAKSLNCVKGPTVEPCDKCDNCREIRDSVSLDVIEIDGASNNSVDDIRNLRESVKFASASSRYKVYIIDEVHMLSESAFNALLKTLEEPPAHVIFIFATTEPNQIPATVLSRCQRFNFKRIHLPTIIERVREIAGAEKIDLSEEAAYLLSQRAEGSLRDVLSLLDQVVAFGGEKISADLVLKTLGLVNQEVFFTLTEQIRKKDGQAVISLFSQILDEGADVSEFVNSLNLHFRNLLLSKLNLASEQVLELPQVYVEKYKQISAQYEEKDLLRMLKIVQDLGTAIKNTDPKVSTEIALLRLVTLEEMVQIEELLDKLKEFNHSGGGTQSIKSAATTPIADKGEPKTKAIEPTEVRHGTAYAVRAEPGDIQAGWMQVVEKLKKEKPSLSSFLQDVHLTSFDDKELHLEFAGDRAFQKQLVEKKENLSYLQKVAEEILGTPYKIKLAVNSSKVSSAKPTPVKQAKPDIEELKQKDPLLKDILDTFQGEVI